MRVVIQRVTVARVEVDGATVGEIGAGAVVFVGVAEGDSSDDALRLARKIAALRIFADGGSPFDRSLAQIAGEVLVVSQFTLHGDVRKGNRPSWSAAASALEAEPLVAKFSDALAAEASPLRPADLAAICRCIWSTTAR